MAPPPLASSHGKPAVCLLCWAESACSLQLWRSVTERSPSLFLFVFLSLSFPLVLFHTYSHILPLLLISINSPLSSLPPPAPTSSPPSLPILPPLPAHTPHPQPHHPVARIMTLLTTQTHGGSGYGPAKSSQSMTSITSLAPLSSLGRVGETERWRGCSAVCRLRVDCMLRYVLHPAHQLFVLTQNIFHKLFRGHSRGIVTFLEGSHSWR